MKSPNYLLVGNPGHSSQKHFHYDNVSAQFSQLECAHRCTQSVSFLAPCLSIARALTVHRTRSLRLENFHILAGAHESMEHEKLHKCAENVAKLHDLWGW